MFIESLYSLNGDPKHFTIQKNTPEPKQTAMEVRLLNAQWIFYLSASQSSTQL